MVRKTGYFIVFEGPDGSGKTTQAELLYHRFIEDNMPAVLTEEPGGTQEGRIIRDILLNPALSVGPKTELFLFLADRADHVQKLIEPALTGGKTVVCSRYFYSTLVYQGIARSVAPFSFLLDLNLYATGGRVPDLVFYIDIEPEKALSKAKSISFQLHNYHNGDRIESEGLEFQTNVRKGYLKMAEHFKDYFIVIGAGNKSRDVLSDEIYSHIRRRLLNDRT
jgi:dTMP kinase